MKKSIVIILIGLFLIVCGLNYAQNKFGTSSAFLMDDGNVLRGKIEQYVGGHFLLDSEGGLVEIPIEKVRFIGLGKDSTYVEDVFQHQDLTGGVRQRIEEYKRLRKNIDQASVGVPQYIYEMASRLVNFDNSLKMLKDRHEKGKKFFYKYFSEEKALSSKVQKNFIFIGYYLTASYLKQGNVDKAVEVLEKVAKAKYKDSGHQKRISGFSRKQIDLINSMKGKLFKSSDSYKVIIEYDVN